MGVYLIARIVVFKDNPRALAAPALAVKNSGGSIWRDREHLAWVDPFQPAVWSYNLDIAEEAARKGFDEIQFDYVRFPDARGLVFSQPNHRENRVRAIGGFFREARRRLAPLHVFIAGDIFGYVCWNQGDTDIGQQLEKVVNEVDYVCPMLYPSDFSTESLVTARRRLIPTRSFSLHSTRRWLELGQRRGASGRGCKHSGITRLTGAFTGRRKLAARSKRPRILAPMVGWCGILTMCIPAPGFGPKQTAQQPWQREC